MLILGLLANVTNAGELENWDDETEDVKKGSVLMTGEFLDSNLLKISVEVEEMVTPLLGMAFHLHYQGDKLTFLKYEPGEFLERGGDPFYLVKNLEDKSELVFGETLRRDDAFPLGEGRVVDFYFQIINDDKFELKFSRGVVSTLNTVRQDIDKIRWEDLVLEKGSNKGLISSSGIQSYAPGMFTKIFSSKNLISLVIGLALLSCGVFYYLVKRPREKSVNFK